MDLCAEQYERLAFVELREAQRATSVQARLEHERQAHHYALMARRAEAKLPVDDWSFRPAFFA